MAVGSFSLVEDLFFRGDSAFVAELRKVHHAERLAAFAAQWFADSRPFARSALFDYLDQPLNCFRHEPLVKRLFKLAEKAGDDLVMGAFLVAFDRTIRHQRRIRNRYKHESFASRAAAEAAMKSWEEEGFTSTTIGAGSSQFYATAWKQEEIVAMPGRTTMPRPGKRVVQDPRAGERVEYEKWLPSPEGNRAWFEKKFRLFSLATRRYLRRRAWRYFRTIGKSDPARYIRAATAFLARYKDADADSDIHLIDNWGLVHALFRFSPAVQCPAHGWIFAPGRSVADLAPAPQFEAAWIAHPKALFDLMQAAAGQTVRQWCVRMMRTHHAAWLARQPVAMLLRLADHEESILSELGFDLLAEAADLETVPVEEWLRRLDGDDLAKLQRLSALLAQRLDPARVATPDALRLAAYRSKPVAELGFAMLRSRPSLGEMVALLPLVQAECALRPVIIRWLRSELELRSRGQSELRDGILEFLDSKHADVRAFGWAWLEELPNRNDPAVWQRLMESPYDDVRGPLVAKLREHSSGVDPDAVRRLWAAVLLNASRGSRYKPGVVAGVVDRIAEHPDETTRLLPMLAVAVRSLRGPEFRTGLAGIVRLVERKPELIPAIREKFPELVI